MAHESSVSQLPDPTSHRHSRRHPSRSRSPSPRPSSRSHHHSRKHRHSHHKRKRSRSPLLDEIQLPPRPLILPFKSTPLSKHDLRTYRPMLASYLDIQKQIDIDELSEPEVKGRWKAFMGKWNRGELAEGWYDPQTLAKAIASANEEPDPASKAFFRNQTRKESHRSPDHTPGHPQDHDHDNAIDAADEEEEDEEWGPTLPPPSSPTSKSRSGPTIPTSSDLALRDDLRNDDHAAARESTHHARKAERSLQRERLDELAPRAEPGTRERQLEKKREAAASNRAFAEERGGGAGPEVGEAELMGAADGGVDEVKRMKANMERKKNEREIRREEVLRARAAEREERLVGLREREEKTMDMLRAIAKERFG